MSSRQAVFRYTIVSGAIALCLGVVDAAEIHVKDAVVVVNRDGDYEIRKEGVGIRRVSRQPTIKLRNRTFDPLQSDPLQIDAATAAARSSPAVASLYSGNVDAGVANYIVQFHGQALAEFQQGLTALGAKVQAPLPEQAVIVSMDARTRERVRRMSYVRWVGDFLPGYKLESGLEAAIASGAGDATRYSIMTMDASLQASLAKFIESIGARVNTRSSTSRFEATLTGAQLLEVVRRREVLFVDRATTVGEDMDQVREMVGAEPLRLVAGYTGQGVAGEALDRGFRVSHSELQSANLMVHSPAADAGGDIAHGTQVAGILFATGVNAQARGLLPDAARAIVYSRLSGFGAGIPTFSEQRTNLLELTNPNGPYRAVFQTSSFGHSTTTSYTTVSAEYDEILFEIDILRTQSQGNEGSRNSRPEAWAKNMVAVGGVVTGETLSRTDDRWSGASIGPASDGRIKPELSAQYGNVYTMGSSGDTSYTNFGGTSGATPIVAGTFGLLYQMWADGVFDGGPGKARDVFVARPHTSTARALMINSAFQYTFSGASHNLSRYKQGWGMPDLKKLYDTAQANNWQLPILVNETAPLAPLQTHTYSFNVAGGQPLKATMVYKGPRGNPASSVQRVNDLSLKVTSPSGTVYWGNNGLTAGNWSTSGGSSNTVDTVENVFIDNPQAGAWQVQVVGDEIVQDGNPATTAIDAVYALVATGGSAGGGGGGGGGGGDGGGGGADVTIQENTTGFCGVDGTVDNNNAGYTGAGFADTTNATGKGVRWRVQAAQAGSYTLLWRYANASSAGRPGSLRINGASVTTMPFAVTGSTWATWANTSAVTVTLNAGLNDIELVATASRGLPNIDSMTVSAGAAGAACN